MKSTINFKVYTHGDNSLASQIAYEKFVNACACRGYEFTVSKHSVASAMTVYHVTVNDIAYDDVEYAVFRLNASVIPHFDDEDDCDTFGEIDAENFHDYIER